MEWRNFFSGRSRRPNTPFPSRRHRRHHHHSRSRCTGNADYPEGVRDYRGSEDTILPAEIETPDGSIVDVGGPRGRSRRVRHGPGQPFYGYRGYSQYGGYSGPRGHGGYSGPSRRGGYRGPSGFGGRRGYSGYSSDDYSDGGRGSGSPFQSWHGDGWASRRNGQWTGGSWGFQPGGFGRMGPMGPMGGCSGGGGGGPGFGSSRPPGFSVGPSGGGWRFRGSQGAFPDGGGGWSFVSTSRGGPPPPGSDDGSGSEHSWLCIR